MPGTNFKFQKVHELIRKRRNYIAAVAAERKLKKQMEKELRFSKTQKEKMAV